jgi:hypothetical protein
VACLAPSRACEEPSQLRDSIAGQSGTAPA